MPQPIRLEYGLPTLRIQLGGSGETTRSEVVFQAEVGGPTTEAGRCTTEELGLPERLTTRQFEDYRFHLPHRILESVRQILDLLMPQGAAIWLDLPSPRGYLYLVPWERLLEQLARPIFRLPNHFLRPQTASDSLEVALCGSAPLAKSAFDTVWELERLAALWAGLPQVRVHIFTDSNSYEPERMTSVGPAVVVHDPVEASEYAAPRRTSRVTESTEISNPWMLWIRDSLRNEALDVLHFVTHGYISGDRGAIALASTPMSNIDPSLSRFVGSAEMSSLLIQSGAWCLMLTGPPGNYSSPGLRELADSIAAVHPGVALVHELDLDSKLEQLNFVVEMMFGSGSPVTQAMPGVTCWLHPQFANYSTAVQQALLLTEEGRSSLVQDATYTALTHEVTPAWVAAGARYLEAQQAEWLPTEITEPRGERDQAAVDALRSVSSLLEKHVRLQLGEPGDGEK